MVKQQNYDVSLFKNRMLIMQICRGKEVIMEASSQNSNRKLNEA